MKKILVANRGEIALRIMRSAKEMGIKTVAVFSDADRRSPHVMYADQAVYIGASPSSDSYLNMDKIIEVAKDLNVDGIHPGYGFLSENPQFVTMVEANNITFIGPSALAMDLMGNKLKAKETVKKYNVPMVPGTDQKLTDIVIGKSSAQQIGYPILIKAAAGGGGKGMRVVENEIDFEEQMNLAISEAKSSFGDGSVFIERYVASPRHIEIQILADKHGNIVHLFERECSVQRRHQKVVEEAPSSVLDQKTRDAMGVCAINVAKSCNYIGAGTVEFLLDENNNFYFLEMNTRLQVEHPVTELISSVDLVKEQIKVAMGEELSFSQNDLKIEGHAIEVRVYAEDAANNFAPDIGTLKTFQIPESIGVRVDNGFEQGMEIPIFYDSMLCKLITYGKNRTEAIDRMVRAIDDFKVTGVKTTLPFGKFVMQNKFFRKGNFDTHFVKKYFEPNYIDNQNNEEAKVAALLSKYMLENNSNESIAITNQNSVSSNWKNNR